MRVSGNELIPHSRNGKSLKSEYISKYTQVQVDWGIDASISSSSVNSPHNLAHSPRSSGCDGYAEIVKRVARAEPSSARA